MAVTKEFLEVSQTRADIYRGITNQTLTPYIGRTMALLRDPILCPRPSEDNVTVGSMQALRQADGTWKVVDRIRMNDQQVDETPFTIPAGKLAHEVQQELAAVMAYAQERTMPSESRQPQGANDSTNELG